MISSSGKDIYKNIGKLISGFGDILDKESKHSISSLEQFCSSFVNEDDVGEIVQWLDDIRARNHIYAKREGINSLAEWRLDMDGCLSHIQKRFFRIIGLNVNAQGREIKSWDQPILDNEGTGIIGLLIRRNSGRTEFLMQAKVDVGNRNIVQIGPTVLFNPGNYIDNDKIKKPFLFDEFMSPADLDVVSDSRQSEEGGRFFQEEHIHRILILPNSMKLDIPYDFRWFTLNQIRFFLHMGDVVNSSARSIIACCL